MNELDSYNYCGTGTCVRVTVTRCNANIPSYHEEFLVNSNSLKVPWFESNSFLNQRDLFNIFTAGLCKRSCEDVSLSTRVFLQFSKRCSSHDSLDVWRMLDECAHRSRSKVFSVRGMTVICGVHSPFFN